MRSSDQPMWEIFEKFMAQNWMEIMNCIYTWG